KGVVPRPGIDTDARWGYSHTKGWIFGYKLHLTSTTTADVGKIVVPLTADVTTANIPDNQMCVPLTSSSSSSSVFFLSSVLYIAGDPGYDDKKLYEYSKRTLA
ncbi:MAG: transposase, partial [Candidatus Nitrosocosmicus sp.]